MTDDAKKKHIATAASYDEFRNFVACAEQKRVTRAEMDSLSKPEKGWQTRSKLATGTAGGSKRSAAGLTGRRSGAAAAREKSATLLSESGFPSVAPKSPQAFERDWRRHCPNRELKMRYLSLCGPECLRKIFKTEMDVSLLGQVIGALAETARACEQGTESALPPEVHGAIALELLATAEALPRTGRFSLNVQFMDASDKTNVVCLLEWLRSKTQEPNGATGAGPETLLSSSPCEGGAVLPLEAIEQVRAKFKC